jgi:hypothetical protein
MTHDHNGSIGLSIRSSNHMDHTDHENKAINSDNWGLVSLLFSKEEREPHSLGDFLRVIYHSFYRGIIAGVRSVMLEVIRLRISYRHK